MCGSWNRETGSSESVGEIARFPELVVDFRLFLDAEFDIDSSRCSTGRSSLFAGRACVSVRTDNILLDSDFEKVEKS